MWTLLVATWFGGKLTFAPPLTFQSESACRRGGEVVSRFMATGHVTPASIASTCVPMGARPDATSSPR